MNMCAFICTQVHVCIHMYTYIYVHTCKHRYVNNIHAITIMVKCNAIISPDANNQHGLVKQCTRVLFCLVLLSLGDSHDLLIGNICMALNAVPSISFLGDVINSSIQYV